MLPFKKICRIQILLTTALLHGIGLIQVGCSFSPQAKQEVLEAVIEDMIKGREDPDSLYFLSLGDAHTDPSPDLLAMLQKQHPQVRLGSSASDGPPYFERSTKKPGVLIWIGNPKFSPINRAKVAIEIHAGFLAAGGSIISLKRINGRWSVTEISPTWIS